VTGMKMRFEIALIYFYLCVFYSHLTSFVSFNNL